MEKRMNRDEIFQLLRNELKAAQNRIDGVAERYDAAIRDLPIGLFNLSEAQRFSSISGELNGARQDLMEARGRLDGFLFEGIVPIVPGHAEGFVSIT
jgi:hypothetical protein